MQYIDSTANTAVLYFDVDATTSATTPVKFTSYSLDTEVVPSAISAQSFKVRVTVALSSSLKSALASGTTFKISYGSAYDYAQSVASTNTIEYNPE